MLSPKFMSEEESGLDSDTNEPIFIVHSPVWRSEGMLLFYISNLSIFYLQAQSTLTVLQKFITKLDQRLEKLPKQKGFSAIVRKKGVYSSSSPPREPAWAINTTAMNSSPVEACDDVPPPAVNITTSTDVDINDEYFSDDEFRDIFQLYNNAQICS